MKERSMTKRETKRALKKAHRKMRNRLGSCDPRVRAIGGLMKDVLGLRESVIEARTVFQV